MIIRPSAVCPSAGRKQGPIRRTIPTEHATAMVTDEPISTAAVDVERDPADPTPEAEYELDLSGHCTCCNQTCTRLLGYSGPGEIVGKNMHSLIHYRRADGTAYPEEESPIFRTLRTGERTHIEDDVFWRADGSGTRRILDPPDSP